MYDAVAPLGIWGHDIGNCDEAPTVLVAPLIALIRVRALGESCRTYGGGGGPLGNP